MASARCLVLLPARGDHETDAARADPARGHAAGATEVLCPCTWFAGCLFAPFYAQLPGADRHSLDLARASTTSGRFVCCRGQGLAGTIARAHPSAWPGGGLPVVRGADAQGLAARLVLL